ncbi:autoinducer binding domain-containing protein [Limnohabitans sp.]|uniref:autoinducer binding domain-containing protein n=1 Tax=Limnohabitans sp. TaxID=1907725 RepID=UPI00311F64C8
MGRWQEDLLNLLVSPEHDSESIFIKIQNAVRDLGFEYVSFGLQLPYPVTRPKILLLDNYPDAWRQRYAEQQHMLNDPTVINGRISTKPMIWSDETFAANLALWSDVQDFGISTGWAQSSLMIDGSASLLSLSRSSGQLTASELEAKEIQMRWLVQVAHVALSRALKAEEVNLAVRLTPRERAVLQWAADGKSSQDIADILSLSKSAVDFHFKNVFEKLQAPNKTAAVARAALLGLLT